MGAWLQCKHARKGRTNQCGQITGAHHCEWGAREATPAACAASLGLWHSHIEPQPRPHRLSVRPAAARRARCSAPANPAHRHRRLALWREFKPSVPESTIHRRRVDACRGCARMVRDRGGREARARRVPAVCRVPCRMSINQSSAGLRGRRAQDSGTDSRESNGPAHSSQQAAAHEPLAALRPRSHSCRCRNAPGLGTQRPWPRADATSKPAQHRSHHRERMVIPVKRPLAPDPVLIGNTALVQLPVSHERA